ANEVVALRPDPHPVQTMWTPLSPGLEVTSPGYLNILYTSISTNSWSFKGTVAGMNDQGNLAFNEVHAGSIPVQSPQLLSVINWSSGPDTALGSLGGTNGAANALNNSNQVVGWSQTASGSQHAFLYSKATGSKCLTRWIPRTAPGSVFRG